MKLLKQKNKCKNVRSWTYSILSKHVGIDADWVQRHIAVCPRCQKRLALASKVNLAFNLIKTEPHNLDLLSKANKKAVSFLKHSLRYSRQSEILKTAVPKPSFFEKLRGCSVSAANIAACLTIICLVKFGVFGSIEKFQSDSQNALKYYYASHVGDEIVDDIFKT